MMLLFTGLSIIGVILNIHKRKECFIIWLITNIAWAVYDFKIGAWEQGWLFIVYAVLAMWGLWKWRSDYVCGEK